MNNKIKQRFINYWNSRSGVDYSKIPFTVEMLADGNLQWSLPSSKQITSLKYQVNDDTPVDVAITSGSQNISISNLVAGDKVKFKGVANKYVGQDYQSAAITATSDFIVYGNIMSLFYDENFSDKTEYPTTTEYCLNGLFNGSTHLIGASDLILSALRLYGRTYRDFFNGCTSLINGPKVLPATIIDNHDYMGFFHDCTSLDTAPIILATQSLGNNNMREMFWNCTSLVTPPIISINTDKKGTCQSMFKGCTSLATAPELPQMIVGEDAYREMFYGCTSLTTAPELPATRISACSYSYMFYGCTSLTSMPDILFTSYASTGDPGLCGYMFYDCRNLTTLKPLKLTTYPRAALQHMFDHCTSLVDASIFDMSNFTATESNGEGAFDSLFRDCASLIIPPKLPTFQHCPRMAFREMFRDCTSLATAPEIKATSYGYGALYRMFAGCTSLTTAPVLYAKTLSTNNFGYGCCEEMFDGCKNINYIKSFATSQPVKETTFNWLRGVSNTGTIDCMFPLVFDLNSPNGIPTSWTYNYMNTTEMLHFVNKGSSNATIGWYTNNIPKTIKYSKDNENWTSISSTGDIATLAPNEVLYVKATNSSYEYTGSLVGSHFTMTGGEISVEGNIMSLIDEDNFSSLDTLTAQAALGHMFYNCTSLKYADKLQLLPTTLTEYCYHHMFYGCTSLTAAPALPATTLAQNCYYSMFNGCTSLITAPKLPATTVARYCYAYMFNGCTSLTIAPELPATTLASNCYTAMFNGCTSLTTAPELPATALADYCYHLMFHGCTSLTTAPELPATTLSFGCYGEMFYGCTSLTTAPALPATTLAQNCYYSMFYNCTSLVTTTTLPATTLAQSCYKYMFNGCSNVNKIYMLATDISATDCLVDWLKNTASTGKIYYDVNSITLPVDSDSGIPVGWTGIDIYSLPENKYLTTEALEDGTITFTGDSTSDLSSLSYRVNGGNWTTTTTPKNTTTTVNVSTGDKVEWRASATRLSSDWTHGSSFGGTAKFNVSGNILSMLYDTNFIGQTTLTGYMSRIFAESNVVDASGLVFKIIKTGYNILTRLFIDCQYLVKAPYKYPNTIQPDYYLMDQQFAHCSNLTVAPILAMNTIGSNQLEQMFDGCSSLDYVEIWTKSKSWSSLNNWLRDCASTGHIVGFKSIINNIPSGWTVIDIEYKSNDITYYASKDYAAHVLGYESPQDAIDAGYILQTVNNPDNNWTYYRYTIA